MITVTKLRKALQSADDLDKWHKPGEGYRSLRRDVTQIVNDLDRIKHHDQLILEDLKHQLDRMELADQDENEDAREIIISMVETLLRRLAMHESPNRRMPEQPADPATVHPGPGNQRPSRDINRPNPSRGG